MRRGLCACVIWGPNRIFLRWHKQVHERCKMNCLSFFLRLASLSICPITCPLPPSLPEFALLSEKAPADEPSCEESQRYIIGLQSAPRPSVCRFHWCGILGFVRISFFVSINCIWFVLFSGAWGVLYLCFGTRTQLAGWHRNIRCFLFGVSLQGMADSMCISKFLCCVFDDIVKYLIIRVNVIDPSQSACSVQLGESQWSSCFSLRMLDMFDQISGHISSGRDVLWIFVSLSLAHICSSGGVSSEVWIL